MKCPRCNKEMGTGDTGTVCNQCYWELRTLPKKKASGKE